MARIIVFTLLATISTAWAYSAGAPESTCDDMTPKHPVDPQASELPYKVLLSQNVVKAGEEIDITIGGGKFKGFLIQVRNGDKAVGKFIISDTDKFSKAINCHGATGSAATHKNSTDKEDLVLKWKAPQATGNYVVYVTVAKDGGTFWARKPTQQIKVN